MAKSSARERMRESGAKLPKARRFPEILKMRKD
jgi:hypothetical protein